MGVPVPAQGRAIRHLDIPRVGITHLVQGKSTPVRVCAVRHPLRIEVYAGVCVQIAALPLCGPVRHFGLVVVHIQSRQISRGENLHETEVARVIKAVLLVYDRLVHHGVLFHKPRLVHLKQGGVQRRVDSGRMLRVEEVKAVVIPRQQEEVVRVQDLFRLARRRFLDHLVYGLTELLKGPERDRAVFVRRPRRARKRAALQQHEQYKGERYRAPRDLLHHAHPIFFRYALTPRRGAECRVSRPLRIRAQGYRMIYFTKSIDECQLKT